jgi:Glycosyl transferases group 1
MHTLFVHSERTRRLLLNRFDRQGFDRRIVVVPDPTTDMPSMSREDARRDLGLPGHALTLLFFGETRPDKGVRVLLEAITLEQRWTTVIAGAADDVGEVEAEGWRRRLDNPNRLITRFRVVSADDTARYFRSADAVVLPYRRSLHWDERHPPASCGCGDPRDCVRRGRCRRRGMGVRARQGGPAGVTIRPGQGARRLPRARRCVARNGWQVLGARVRKAYLEAAAGS